MTQNLDSLALLQRLDELIVEANPNSRLFRASAGNGVRASAEFRRIAALPRRNWPVDLAEALAVELTKYLRRPGGDMSLRPLQAVALIEIGIYGGLLGPICVGYGKTLITLLAPYVREASRPLLILPAKLIEKTRHDQRTLMQHWRISGNIHMVSYESLGRVSHAKYLETLNPDLIVCDEVHFVKNTKAAVTRRVKRYLEAAKVPFVGLSGTVTSKSLHDFAHLSKWALWEKSPLPIHFPDLQDWANAIDHKTQFAVRTSPGVLVEFCDTLGAELDDIRAGVMRRITETPGVVATSDERPGASLEIEVVKFDLPGEIQDLFTVFRDTWETPDGWALISALDAFMYASQLCLGFYYRLDPRPPKAWLDARREWASFVRGVLARNKRGLDSPMAVALACSKDEIDREAFDGWRAVRDTFKPNQVATWLHDFALDKAGEWIEARRAGEGLVFTSYVEFGQKLAARAGVPYCGRQGKTSQGEYIEHFRGRTLVCSLQSNKEGRNLQTHWNQGLIPSPPSTGQTWEQLLGRMHRPGQPADTVQFQTWSLCDEQAKAIKDSQAKAEYIGQTTGQIQKLQYATIIGE